MPACPESSTVHAKRKRMHLHFEELVERYFSMRIPGFSDSGMDEEEDQGLDQFGECISRFTQYSAMRPLATINYNCDMFNQSSNIASSIEFDKDSSDDHKVKLWSLDNERSITSLEAKANVCCVQFNPSSRYHLAFGSADHCVHYYDLRNMKEEVRVFKGHRKAVSGGSLKAGKSRVLYGVSDEFPVVSVVGLGEQNQNYDPIEERDESKEAIRTAVAAGYRSLGDLGLKSIQVDPCGDGEAAAEGALLAAFKYQDLKSKKKEWTRGATFAEGQNIARRLMETPANILTPTNFAQEAVNCLEGLGVEVMPRTYEWAKERNMNSFLSVTRGSGEPPVFLELSYRGKRFTDEKPLAIVGKGVTFDTGGISLKPSANMDKMRADMGGAACTVGSIFIAAALGLPINIKGFIPLCENMPGSIATKPGDVVVASNGKSIQIDNTDAEGRLILADALHYASQHSPRAMVNMATLTGAMAVSLGSGATGVFCNSKAVWEAMHKAGTVTGDREFVSCDHWMHMDIAGVMENKDEVSYLGKGMSGRPTRTVATFAELIASGQTGL
ncbi:Cytosol aminopeptidase [Portunus trituberculatus]|uniref:Cytosol aminopeptidase n=1 Tax=Portunus trituberculatus TaxID=210409 RepID=A0A5B7CTZ1_PORTR|nr:Cytosol aminopeptidase [Portunus trituberculatus]